MYAIACSRLYVEVLALFPLRNVFPPTIFIQFCFAHFAPKHSCLIPRIRYLIALIPVTLPSL